MPRLLNVNSYHYVRGGADAVYFSHAALMEAHGWENGFFSMHYPKNLPTPWSRYFIDELQFGHDYSVGQKIVKAGKVIYSFEAQRKLRQLLADFRPDIAHLHNIYHHFSPSILPVLRKAGVPTVMTAHDLKIACPNNKMLNRIGVCERCKGGNYLETIKNRCVQNSLAASVIVAAEATVHRVLDSYRRNLDRIVVPSKFFMRKFEQWGWPPEIFTYIPNFIDVDLHEPGYDPGDYFVYVGRLSPEKGIGTLISAAQRARVRLKIAGTGPLMESFQQMLAGGDGRIELLGYQTGSRLFDLIRGARALVLPSESYENAPISVLEAFAMGKPVIGAHIAGIPELVRPGESGWLFESGNLAALTDRLVQVLATPDSQIAEMGQSGRRFVERGFNRQKYVESMYKLYAELGVKLPERELEPACPV
ncbi:MAG: glycosyltransferase family 4 protein [Burkholderiaceae bacterium]